MKHLLLADDGCLADVAPLSLKYKIGIEVQSFYKPDYYERTPDALAIHKSTIAPITVRGMHGPFCDLNPGSTDHLIVEVTKRRLSEGYRFAEALNIQHLIFHNNYVPGFSSIKKWLPRAIQFWKDFLNEHSSNIDIHIENTLERTPSILIDLIDAINNPQLTVNLDIGHTHCFTTYGTVNWIKDLGHRIKYVHLHDNNGQKDEHLGFTKGTIPIFEICEALETYAPSACWSVEADVDGMQISIHWLIEHRFLKVE